MLVHTCSVTCSDYASITGHHADSNRKTEIHPWLCMICIWQQQQCPDDAGIRESGHTGGNCKTESFFISRQTLLSWWCKGQDSSQAGLCTSDWQALGVDQTQEDEMLTRDASVPKPVSKVCSVLVAVVNWLSRPSLTYSMSLEIVSWS